MDWDHISGCQVPFSGLSVLLTDTQLGEGEQAVSGGSPSLHRSFLVLPSSICASTLKSDQNHQSNNSRRREA